MGGSNWVFFNFNGQNPLPQGQIEPLGTQWVQIKLPQSAFQSIYIYLWRMKTKVEKAQNTHHHENDHVHVEMQIFQSSSQQNQPQTPKTISHDELLVAQPTSVKKKTKHF